MILYQGIIEENSQLKTRLASLKDDCYETLNHAHPLETDWVIQACNQLTQKIIAKQFDHIIQPLLTQYDIPEAHFKHYLKMFSQEALEQKVAFELNPQSMKTTTDETHERKLYPLGILFHIAAGNIDVLPAYSVIEGLLAGNINILKLPTGDQGVSVTLLNALIQIEPRLKPYIYVFDVPSTDQETLLQFSKIADAIVVWGGDDAVKAARVMATANTKIIDWGHKLSFAYASLDASDTDLKALAQNIFSTNQLLCSSAQGIYVDTRDYAELDRFAERFFNIMKGMHADYQPVPLGIRSQHTLELYYEQIIQKDTQKTIFKHREFSVVACRDQRLEPSLLFRNVWVKTLPKEAIINTLKPHKNHLQTASILASKDSYHSYQELLIKAGVVRIKAPNEMSYTHTNESHDGMLPLRLYTRIVDCVVPRNDLNHKK